MKILHLYHDIMNLYGEYANVSALERMLEKSGVKFTTDRLTLFDNADLGDYDFIYIGSGTEKNQKLVLQDFKKYKDFLVEYINSGKVILMTGNSFEMLGKTITDSDGKVFDGLGIYDFTVTEQNKRRITGDIVYTSDILTKPIVGFVNKCSEIKGIENHLFTVKHGLGDYENAKISIFLNILLCRFQKIRMASNRVRITLTTKERATKLLSANSQKDLRSKF